MMTRSAGCGNEIERLNFAIRARDRDRQLRLRFEAEQERCCSFLLLFGLRVHALNVGFHGGRVGDQD